MSSTPQNITNSKIGGHISEIPVMKFLLMMGVIIVHSNVYDSQNPGTFNPYVGAFCDYISFGLMRGCVPGFFLISGYLLFKDIANDRFNWSQYGRKLKRRIHTLLIPYLFWNAVCIIQVLVKSNFPGFDTLGLVTDQGIDIKTVLLSFIALPAFNYDPIALAFWFIRNLMLFVLLTPLAWVLARKGWLVISVLAIGLFFGSDLLGFVYFLPGCWLGLKRFDLKRLTMKPLPLALIVITVLLLAPFADFRSLPPREHLLVLYAFLPTTFMVGYNLTLALCNVRSRFFKNLVASTFFLYASHQCYCTGFGKLWIHFMGRYCDRVAVALFTYIANIVSIVGLSFVTYLVLRKLFPRFTAIITGGRT